MTERHRQKHARREREPAGNLPTRAEATTIAAVSALALFLAMLVAIHG